MAAATVAALASSLVWTSASVLARQQATDTGQQIHAHSRPQPSADGRRQHRQVTVRDLPTSQGTGKRYETKLRGFDAIQAPRGPSGVLVAPDPVFAITNSSTQATEAVDYTGLSFGNTGFEPPDPWIAVGPEHVIQAVNTSLLITNRVGGSQTQTSLLDFFGINAIPDYDAEVFDPRVIYDSLHGRWIAIEASFDCYPWEQADVGTGYLDIAVSTTADPTGLWNISSIYYPDAIPDYPDIGTSTDKVVVSGNVFGLFPSGGALGCDPAGGLLGTEMDAMAWSQLVTASNPNIDYFFSPVDFPNSFFSWRPALQTPATSTTVFVVAQRGDNGVAYARITGNPATGTSALSTPLDLTGTGVVAGFLGAPAPQQPGSPSTIANAFDARPTDAVWQNNLLSFISTYPCDPAGGVDEDRDCVRVTELSTSASPPTLHQDFLIGEEAADHYMGGVGYAGNGALHVVWTRSSATAGEYASSYTAYHAPTAVLNRISARDLLAAGTGTYPGDRWGDYVGVAQDPQVPNAVWQANQYSAGATDVWATRISQLQTGGSSYVPITPLRVLDSRPGQNIGLSGAFSVNVPRSWTVAGFGTIPSNAIAVTGNVTVANQTAAGYVAVTPNATPTPPSSTMNFPLGDVRANNFTVPLSSSGRLAAVYKAVAGNTAHIIVDITGYFLAGDVDATYATINPVRVMDTRPAPSRIGPFGAFPANTPRTVQVGGTNGIPSDATAITGNLTVTGQTKAGYLSVTPEPPVGTPSSSTLNFPLGDTRANGLTADLNATGKISITYTAVAPASTNVILDVTGYYRVDPSGLLFYPLNPGRILDSRPGAVLSGISGSFTANTPRTLNTDGHWGVPVGAEAVSGNLTVVGQTAAGYVSITPNPPVGIPTTSTLNFPLGDIRANGVTVPLSDTGNMSLTYAALSGKKTHLLLDLTGYFK
jgi:hypothetical protein